MQGSGSLATAMPQGGIVIRASVLLLTILRRIVDVTLIALLGIMVVSVLAQVAGRYVFNFSIAGATEVATFAQIWMVLLGAGYAMRARLHVSIDTVVAKLPPLLARIILVPVAALCLWFLWVVFEGGLLLIEIGAIQTSAALQISMQVPYIALPVSAAYFALEAVLVFGATILGHAPVAPDAGVRAD